MITTHTRNAAGTARRQLRRTTVAAASLAAGIVAALFMSVLAPPAGATQPSGPRHYYLSLGSSLGFGLQGTRFLAMLDAGTYTPTAFNTGYTDDLATAIRARLRPDPQV